LLLLIKINFTILYEKVLENKEKVYVVSLIQDFFAFFVDYCLLKDYLKKEKTKHIK
jgi:hypothetical protein